MSSKFRRLAALAAAAATLPVVVIGVAAGAAGAEPGPGLMSAPAATTYTGPPIPVPCVRRIEINDRFMLEGTRSSDSDSAYTYMTFEVTTNFSCTREGTVEYQTVNVSADSWDYVATSGTLRFNSGSSATKHITVLVKKDGSPGGTESFALVLTDASSGIDVEDAVGRGNILNDDTVCVPPPGWVPQPPYYPDYHCSE